MKVYKFGGASVKDAAGIQNVAQVLRGQGFQNCLLVVSAMGKTTNALELVVEKYIHNADYATALQEQAQAHAQIIAPLFAPEHAIFASIAQQVADVQSFLDSQSRKDYDFIYDQVVSLGEFLSSSILSAYLNQEGLSNQLLNAKAYLKTNSQYREGEIDWAQTTANIELLNKNSFYVTQGFIAANAHNHTVTLGREGSDYSAAIFANALNAEQMTIWKDVPGVMTGDPRKFKDVELLDFMSYEEAIEMAYYGASVIHPKTLQPLKQKNIDFYVKSFLAPEMPGTKVGNDKRNQEKKSYIIKENQILLNIATKDFSFVAEQHMSEIFTALAKLNIKVSLMQNSAISLALCLEDKYYKTDEFCGLLAKEYHIQINKKVSLLTIRHAQMDQVMAEYQDRNILIEQMSKNSIQLVIEA
jgi:aspartate kinase